MKQQDTNVLTEQRKRIEMEDQLKIRGEGHEREVEMRLKFENELNHSMAQNRVLKQQYDIMKGEQDKILSELDKKN